MMNTAFSKVRVGLMAAALLLPVTNAAAQPIACYPKVDNFVLFVDQSGSMYQRHAEAGELKAIMAKEAVRQIVPMIPDSVRLGSLFAFAPFERVAPPATLWRRAITSGIERIPDSQPIALRSTPMADGIEKLDAATGWQKGVTAVIVLSDGGDNGYEDPIETARAMVAQHPGMCIHVVSFADGDHGRRINEELSRLGKGCHIVDGPTLLRDAAKREQFVRDAFCGAAPAKRRLVLRGVNFDFDESTIPAEGRPVLDEAIATLKAETGVSVSVEGHTDAVGSDAYNQALSERRAAAVADYLAAGGIARGRMSTQGFGEANPVASNATDDGRAQNRRVEFRIVGQ